MLSLADLRTRDVALTWQEAVAIVQELSATVLESGSVGHLPDMRHVAVYASGDVLALPGSPKVRHPVRHLATMLGDLVKGSAAPPELLTFIARASALPPCFESVDAFSRALSFFERPGRRDDLERLVARAVALRPQPDPRQELRKLQERSAVSAFRPQPEAPRAGRPWRRVALVTVLAIAATAAVAATLYSRGDRVRAWGAAMWPATPLAPAATRAEAPPRASSPPPVTPPAPAGAAGSPAPDVAPAPDRPVAGARAAAPGPAGSTTRAATDPAASSKMATPVPPRSGQARAGSSGHKVANEDLARPLPPVASSAAPVVSAPPHAAATVGAGRGSASPESAEPAGVPPAVPTTETAATIYSSEDEGVTPPVMVRPMLPAEPPLTVPPDQVGTLDLVIDEAGNVETVKLSSPANRYQERMLVASAKSWKFRPAMRNGQPVRYRTRLRVTI